MADEKESEKEESGRNTALLRLPFGLCKRYGIAIQDSWTPRDAWNALKGRRGIDPDEAMDKYVNEQEESKPKSVSKTPQERLNDSRNEIEEYTKASLAHGSKEMQEVTSRLFEDDHWAYKRGINGKKGQDFYRTDKKFVSLSGHAEGDFTIHALGETFYHESWHAIDHQYSESEEPLSVTYKTSSGKTLGETLAIEADAQIMKKVFLDYLYEVGDGDAEVAYRKAEELLPNKKGKLTRKELRTARWLMFFMPQGVGGYGDRRYKWASISDVIDGFSGGELNLLAGHSKRYWAEDKNNRAVEAFAEIMAAKATNPASYEVLQRYIPKTVKAANEIYDALKTNKFKSRG